ncbi:MAG: TraB/GumN family protein, partial [Bacteroidota bacterium]
MKKLSLVFFSILLSLIGFAQGNDKGSLLWEISGKGLPQPSYLFGTFHIMCKDQFSISAILESKIAATNQFYGELDMDDPNLQATLMQKIIMKDKTIESMMDSSSFKSFNDAFKKITGFPATQFNHYKPFFHLSLLTLKTIPCLNFVQPETELMQIAKKGGKAVLGLETVEEQMIAVDSQPLDSQIISLQKMVLNFDST